MTLAATVREYYARVDACDFDWIVALFDESAIYERADEVYAGRSAIAHFFRHQRRIRGVHHLNDVVTRDDLRWALATGGFVGAGAEGDPRAIGFADIWRFDDHGLVVRRQTFLAAGGAYVRE